VKNEKGKEEHEEGKGEDWGNWGDEEIENVFDDGINESISNC